MEAKAASQSDDDAPTVRTNQEVFSKAEIFSTYIRCLSEVCPPILSALSCSDRTFFAVILTLFKYSPLTQIISSGYDNYYISEAGILPPNNLRHYHHHLNSCHPTSQPKLRHCMPIHTNLRIFVLTSSSELTFITNTIQDPWPFLSYHWLPLVHCRKWKSEDLRTCSAPKQSLRRS